MQMDIDGKKSKKSISIKRELITKYLKDQNLRKISKGGKKERRKVLRLVYFYLGLYLCKDKYLNGSEFHLVHDMT